MPALGPYGNGVGGNGTQPPPGTVPGQGQGIYQFAPGFGNGVPVVQAPGGTVNGPGGLQYSNANPNNQNPTGTVGSMGSAGTGQAPQWNYYDPNHNFGGHIGNSAYASQTGDPTVGNFGGYQTYNQAVQQANQRFSIANDVNYGNYEGLGTQAQQAALYGQNVLNAPGAANALQAQQQQAYGPSFGQAGATAQQNNALGMLGNAAAGNGPTAADIQGQQAISQAMRSQLTAGASARGGAYQQAGAMQQAGQNAAQIQAQGAANSAQLRAQEQQNAMGQYAGAAGQAVSGANQAFAGQAQALGAATGAQQAEQGMGLNYYNQLANLYQGQSSTAANLASNQVANDYGLAGTQLQTSTQQNIANQQTGMQAAGAIAGTVGTALLALGSTGGAMAAAKGARDQGVPEHEAAAIGAHVGQAIGKGRVGPVATAMAKPADTAAAKRGAMTPDEMHSHIAKLRAAHQTPKPLPGPATEPMAAHAYAAGSHLAQLAKMHAAQQHGRTHAVEGRP